MTGETRAFRDDAVASAALALFSLTVAAGFARVFAEWQWFDNLAVLVVLGHGSALVMRRLRFPGWVAVPLLAVVLAWAIGAMHYRSTFTAVFPTSESWQLFRSELELVQQQFRTAVAPVLYGGGWDVLAAIGLASAIVLSDTFAFRAYARAEALVPGGVLFVFVAALGADRQRISLTIALVAAGVLATVVLRAFHAPKRAVAMGTRGPFLRLVAPAGVAAALAIALVAGAVGPRIPGANAEPIYDTRGRGGGSVTEVISPLVDIRSRLTNRSNSEMFVVQAPFESYWRSSALPRFDGSTWGLPERSLSSTSGGLAEPRVGATELRQRLRIVNLGGSLVPAAADPIAASAGPGIDLRWNADAATLVRTDGELSTGDTFDIVSATPRFDQATLAAATSTDAGDPIYLELPDNFPSSVGETAREVTAGATNAYDRALALQWWFRNEFRYSLEVQAGHGTNAIEGFLRERVGYCEQFAGTYAAMMRTLGHPARVAVGFTPGTARGDGSFSVLGKNAHAWPEVWFDGLGWVPFEPTPGRGAPGADAYTGVAPQQDDSGVDPDAPRADPDDETTPTSSIPVPTPTDPGLNLPEGELDAGASPDDDFVVADPDEAGSSGIPWPLVVAVLVGLLAVVAPAAVRWRLRRRAPSADLQLARLWRRALLALGDVGVPQAASQTPLETAAVTSKRFPVAARPINSLAEAVTTATYQAPGTADLDRTNRLGSSAIRDCAHWCKQVERAVADSTPLWSRVRNYFTRY